MALLSLVAKLGLDSTGFEQGINKASKQASSFGSSLKASLAAAFSVAAVGAFLRGLNDTIGRIKDLSEQFNVTTDEVQNVDFALKQSGMAFEDFGQAMSKMGQARREAVQENGDLRRVFERYGLTVEKLNNPQLRNFDLLMMMSSAMARMNITAKEQTQIQDILGLKAARLANVLATLADTKPPNIFKEEDIARIDRASKALDNVYSTIQKMAAGPTARFAETLDKSLQDWSQKPWWKKVFTADLRGGPFGKAFAAAIFGKPAEEEFKDTIGNLLKFVGDIPKNIAKPAVEMLNPKANADGLWVPDSKNKAAAEARTTGMPMQSADQLGRIGAFSGGASNNVVEQVKKTTATLVEIKRVLEFKGIVVKDL